MKKLIASLLAIAAMGFTKVSNADPIVRYNEGCTTFVDDYGTRDVCKSYYFNDAYGVYFYWDPYFNSWIGPHGYWNGGRFYYGFHPQYHNYYHRGFYHSHGGGFHTTWHGGHGRHR